MKRRCFVMLDARNSMNLLMTFDDLFFQCMKCRCYRASFASSPHTARTADDEFCESGRTQLYAPYEIDLERVS